MPHQWNMERWTQNSDGSYVRNRSGKTVGYADMSKADLAAELESRGLAKSGNKDELIARLEEADAAPAGAEA